MATRLLVVGLGEVGRAVYEVARDSGRFEVYGYDVDTAKTTHRLEEIPRPVDILHVAIPYSEKFVEIVSQYASEFKPRAVIIHSTVAPGTTRRLHAALKLPVAFSPVRGKHPKIREHLYFWPKWVAALPREFAGEARRHLEDMGLKVRVCEEEPEALELAKLWETVYRAVMIAAWQEIDRIARRYGVGLKTIAEFTAEVHSVLRDRPVYYPDYIGGHCLIPNTQILHSVAQSKLLEFVLESNEKRLRELQDPGVRREVEDLRELFLSLTRRDYYA
ncbi:GDP-mannose dehydrogenase [Infirmifilum lucidum]|uniref:GDP-mannose dehydrogenase n=1 Tax=Infirmifilum lucidum TaxID=2776706 RepID=A0A7L9FIQ3_9CREN|nr:GDP-mannose dehydrogenase [Infirmifilum lucidum]